MVRSSSCGNICVHFVKFMLLESNKEHSIPLLAGSSRISSLTNLSTPRVEFDPEMLKNMSIGTNEPEDTEMLGKPVGYISLSPISKHKIALDLETQPFPNGTVDPIESFTRDTPRSIKDNIAAHEFEDNGLECDCGIPVMSSITRSHSHFLTFSP